MKLATLLIFFWGRAHSYFLACNPIWADTLLGTTAFTFCEHGAPSLLFLANAMLTCGYVLPGGLAADPLSLNQWLTHNEGYLTTSKLRPWDLNQKVLPRLNFDKARIGYLNEAEIVGAWEREGLQVMIYAD